ncbi:MAG TPA: hypothetical protein PLD95_02160 [bacterium]|jgi:hypothetical protein|nr:MAG: hypothetical protein BWX59_01914 [Bacteroidetes bacterium ADurb.Bin028]HOG38253.1 hypothetical protein [bacterium]
MDEITMIEKQREKLTIAYGVLEFHRQLLTQLMSSKTEFEIDIIPRPSGGFVVLDVESNSIVAPLDACIDIILKKGYLVRKDFFNISI